MVRALPPVRAVRCRGEKPRTLLSRQLESEADREVLAREIAAIRADDGYTDLGLALESLESALASRTDGSAQAVALFITDGKNAPAPSSPYSGKDLSVDVRFKDIGRKISMKGWQLYVVGLGSQTDAAAVASAVEGSVLAAPKEALAAESLSAYVAETAKATEERSVAAGSAAGGAGTGSAAGGAAAGTGSAGAGTGGSEGGGLARGALPIGVILIILALAVSIALFFLMRARKAKEKDKDEEKEQPEDKDEA